MKTATAMKRARLHRLELIALGMAIAKEGDRAAILDEIESESLSSGLIGDCLRAIETQDPGDIRAMMKALKQWGLKVDGSVRDAIIAQVNLGNAERRLGEAMKSVDTDQIQESLERIERCSTSYAKAMSRYQGETQCETVSQ